MERFFLFSLILFVGIGLVLPNVSHARIELVKSPISDTVYFVDAANVRHVFPNVKTYASWYGDDFSKVVTMSVEYLSGLKLGPNITMRPGSLVKVPSSDEVYAVEPGGNLREIENEDIARFLYGDDWNTKVIDVSESFWQNYTVGDPVTVSHQIPDGTLYQIKGETPYYYKYRGAIQPFSSADAVEANGLSLDNLVIHPQSFISRSRPIVGNESRIFDPGYEMYSSGADCRNTGLRGAFVFVTEHGLSGEHRAMVEELQKDFPEVWNLATDGLSTMSFEPEILVLEQDDYLWHDASGDFEIDINEVAYSYFDERADNIDFLIVFNDFYYFPDRTAEFYSVTNGTFGINHIILKAGPQYGSTGKLKGLVNMGNLESYILGGEFAYFGAMNLLLHEVGHNWGASVQFDLGDGIKRNDLLEPDDYNHWSEYVGFSSPLGGYGWELTGPNTYTNRASLLDPNTLKAFAPLDMYLMGLYPASTVPDIVYLVPSEADLVNNTITATSRVVSVDDIIRAHGPQSCTIR